MKSASMMKRWAGLLPSPPTPPLTQFKYARTVYYTGSGKGGERMAQSALNNKNMKTYITLSTPHTQTHKYHFLYLFIYTRQKYFRKPHHSTPMYHLVPNSPIVVSISQTNIVEMGGGMGGERYVPFLGTFRSSSFSSWYLYNHISSSNICLYCVRVYNGIGRGRRGAGCNRRSRVRRGGYIS